MGVASLVLGIISIIIGIIPFCGIIALIPAIIGFILGIVDTVVKSKKNLPKGVSIAGLILSILAIIFIIGYFIIVSIGAASYSALSDGIVSQVQDYQNSYYEDYYDDYYNSQAILNETYGILQNYM